MPKKQRDYKREYAIYHGKPEEIKRRALRNKARRKLKRLGLVFKGDGKDVHHKNRVLKNSSLGNLAAIAKERNRSIK